MPVAGVRSRHPGAIPGATVLLALVIRLGFWASRGTRLGGDSALYRTQCSLWATDPTGALSSFFGVEYAGFTLPMCGTLALTGSVGAWILVQVLLSAGAAGLVSDVAQRLYGVRAAIAAGLVAATLFETFQWDAYLLSDSLFATLVAAALWSQVVWREAPTAGRAVLCVAVLYWIGIARPGGWLHSAGFAAGMVAAWPGPGAGTVRTAVGLVAVALVSAVVLAAVSGQLGPRVSFYAHNMPEKVAAGVVMVDDPTWDAPGASALVIYARRALVLWLPVAPRFSRAHDVLNLLALSPVMLLGLAGLARELLGRRRPAVWVLAVPIAVVQVCVIALFIDYDWRYRGPMMSALVILASSWFATRGTATSAPTTAGVT